MATVMGQPCDRGSTVEIASSSTKKESEDVAGPADLDVVAKAHRNEWKELCERAAPDFFVAKEHSKEWERICAEAKERAPILRGVPGSEKSKK
ncbi:MAG TPA: hypothetical protein VL944_01910 [Candidatus Acidoferrum sp.]|nr:hypothetical protein [Candidatus Acidoferrum sp.]